MNWLKRLWDRLTGPNPRITDPDTRRRARLLSSLMLGMAISSVMLVGAIYIARRGQLTGAQYSSPMMAVLILAYVLSRTRWPLVGAWLATLGSGLVTVSILPFIQDPNLASRAMMFLAVSVVFASLLLRARGAMIVSLMVVAAGLALPAFLPYLSFQTASMPLVVISLIALMATAAAFLQERSMETIRRQAEEITRRGESLEEEVDQRTHVIMTVAEVGRTITGARNLDALLKQVVQLIVERFDFYHAQIFLVDEAGEQAILRESSGPIGQRLLVQGHKLPVDSRSVIGQVTSLGEPVIALDTDTSPIHRQNELLPNTRAEMALPLRVGGEIIGALDIQSIHPNAFADDDVPVFQTMADQLAVAIENTRLFEKAQSNLEAIERLNQQLTGDAWRAYMAGRIQAAPLGYHMGARGLEPIGDSAAKDADTISLPLKVRGEPIGAIDIKPKETQEPPDEEVQAMLEAVAERVAVALDNTRLAEQAQRTAWREQIVNQISAKLQRSHDLQIILRTAATELGRAMGMSRGFARLVPPRGQMLGEDEER
jgi:GAF domain-containing protein/membrane protein implicated in regulation of membrane protease activity